MIIINLLIFYQNVVVKMKTILILFWNFKQFYDFKLIIELKSISFCCIY